MLIQLHRVNCLPTIHNKYAQTSWWANGLGRYTCSRFVVLSMNVEPKVGRLLELLKNSNSVTIAERMIRSWLDNGGVRCLPRSDGKATCICTAARKHSEGSPASTPCREFHWSCFLRYLSGMVLRATKGSEEVVE